MDNNTSKVKVVLAVVGISFVLLIIVLFGSKFFRLLSSAFGWFDALVTTMQSLVSGAPGICNPGSPGGLKCQDSSGNKFTGSICCASFTSDGKPLYKDGQPGNPAGQGTCSGKKITDTPEAFYTCSTTDNICCGCAAEGSQYCPNQPSGISQFFNQLTSNPLIIILVVASGLGIVLAGIGKLLTGRTGTQAKQLVDSAKRISNESRITKKDVVLRAEEIRITGSENEQQKESLRKMSESREKIARAEAEIQEARANNDPEKEREANDEADQEAREEEIAAQEVLDEK